MRSALQQPGAGRATAVPARRGFTLVELIATVVILAVIGSMASRTMMIAMDGYMAGATRAQLHSDLSITMDRIERELREIPVKPEYGSIAPYITSTTASSIAWIGPTGSASSLTRSGSQLNFVNEGAASAVMLTDVSGFTVQTRDESAATLAASLSGTATDAIRTVTIEITLQRSGVTESLRSTVYLRCTMEGAPT